MLRQPTDETADLKFQYPECGGNGRPFPGSRGGNRAGTVLRRVSSQKSGRGAGDESDCCAVDTSPNRLAPDVSLQVIERNRLERSIEPESAGIDPSNRPLHPVSVSERHPDFLS